MAFAAMESQTMSLRIRRAKAEAAERGIPNAGGSRGFGHTPDMRDLVPDEAEAVREASAMLLAGHTLMGICRHLNEAGFRSTRGLEFQVTSLRRLLISPRLAGLRKHHSEAYPSEEIEPIVERETWERVRALLTAPGRGVYAGERARALSGLVRCGRCGARMSVKRRPKRAPDVVGAPLYRCVRQPGLPACGRMVVTAEPLERLIGEVLAQYLDTPELTAAMSDGEFAAHGREIAALRAQREALVQDHYVARLVARPDFLRALAVLDERITRAEGALARLRRRELVDALGPGESVARAWESRPPAWRRELAAAHLESVIVNPALRRGSTTFDPRRVDIRWRAQ
jgi:hypothetical protein